MDTPAAPAQDARFAQAKAAFLAGLACQGQGDALQAEQHYLASLALLPGRASTLVNLAATQLQLARPADALASADAALAAEPDSADALWHRSTALAQLGQVPPALEACQRLLALVPDHAPAWTTRGNLLRETQRMDEAAACFEQALRLGGDAALNAYYLAAVQTSATPPATSPPAYVQGLFDAYAQDFDRHLLQSLHYRGHEELVALLLVHAGRAPGPAIDLGCGTGLCGSLLRPHVGRLIGVDMSAGMLAQAARLGVYDHLEQADAVDFLRRCDERPGLLLAADVLIYIGDLQPLFAAAQSALQQGLFAVSVEELEEQDADFRLLPSLRYAHSRRYLQRLAATHGFAVLAMRATPVREDQGQAVPALYLLLQRR